MRRGNISNRVGYAVAFNVELLFEQREEDAKTPLLYRLFSLVDFNDTDLIAYSIDKKVKNVINQLYLKEDFSIYIVSTKYRTEDVRQVLREHQVLFNRYMEFESIESLRDYLYKHSHVFYYFDTNEEELCMIGDKAEHYKNLRKALGGTI